MDSWSAKFSRTSLGCSGVVDGELVCEHMCLGVEKVEEELERMALQILL